MPQLLKPTQPRACALQKEKLLQCEAHTQLLIATRESVHSNEDPAQPKRHKLIKFFKKIKKKNIAQKIINSKEHHKISAEFFSKKCISTLLNINHRIYKDSRILQPEYKYRKHDSLLQQNLNFSCYRLTITIRKTMSIYIKIDQLDSYPEVCLNNLSKKILTHY